MDEGATRANPALGAESQGWASDLDRLAFDQARLTEYLLARPLAILKRAAFLASVGVGIWWAWQKHSEDLSAQGQEAAAGASAASLSADGAYTMSLKQVRAATLRGEALRAGLAEMGVFFVKVGQTMAQRPDLVGDELAEELKGLQEKNAPFDDAIAHQIIAEDLGLRGPLAPGVEWEGCTPSAPPLLASLDPRHVASASLGQVYRGHCHDGREVALKVQRPGVRDVIGLDWAVAVLAVRSYVYVTDGLNDYSMVVDTVTQGIRKELDYHVEAANLEEFAVRHAFLPFVSSPGWIPELTGPQGSARVLAMRWYPSRAPSELSREERRELVEMAVEACVVQLLVTGFVHADPHEGNLRLGDDGRIVFLDFGLMDRVDFGVMELFAAGIRSVLAKDWKELTKIMQEVRFTPTPLLKRQPRRDGSRGRSRGDDIVPCRPEEFAEVLGEQMRAEEGGTARFGAMATALKKMSSKYVMLTPAYVALLCRTFITLEGLLGDDPEMAESFNIYEVALPFAVRRVLSPRTKRGRAALRETILREPPAGRRAGLVRPLQTPTLRWETFADFLLEDAEDAEVVAATQRMPASAPSPLEESSDAAGTQQQIASFGATEGVQRRILFTTEGAALRRFLYEVDLFSALQFFLVSQVTRPLRERALEGLVAHLARRRSRARSEESPSPSVRQFGPRSAAACERWGAWDGEDPYKLPPAVIKTSKKAWRLVLRRQLRFAIWPPWRLPYRATVGLSRILWVGFGIWLQARRRSKRLRRQAAKERHLLPAVEDHGPVESASPRQTDL